MQDKVNAFANFWTGKDINPDRMYGNQCKDVADQWCNDLWGDWINTIRPGDARISFDNSNPAYFEKIVNNPRDPNLIPRPGDLVVYNPNHIALVLWADNIRMGLLEQNGDTVKYDARGNVIDKGVPAYRVTRSYAQWIPYGWLRPRVETIPSLNQGEIMQTDEDVILAYNNFRQGDTSGFGWPSPQEIAFWKGKPFKAILEAARGGEVKARNAQFEALANFHNVWAPKLDELNSRPTKADLQALKDQATAESAKVAELTQALADEQAKPPQIVTETVTKEITLPFTDKDGVNWLKNLFARIFNRKEK